MKVCQPHPLCPRRPRRRSSPRTASLSQGHLTSIVGPAPRTDRPVANRTSTRPTKAALGNPDASGHPVRAPPNSSEGSENTKTRSDRHNILVDSWLSSRRRRPMLRLLGRRTRGRRDRPDVGTARNRARRKPLKMTDFRTWTDRKNRTIN